MVGKTIDVKPMKITVKSRHIIILRQFIFMLALCLVGALAAKYYFLPKYFPHKPQVVQETTSALVPQVEVKAIVPVAEVKPEAKVEESSASQIAEINKRLDGLTEQNNGLLAYFAARDLKESLGDNAAFKTQLEFVRDAVGDDPNINGRLDMLEQAANGVVTREKLIADLKILEKNMAEISDGSLGGSIKNALGNLVRVTKVHGDIGANDYNSILKRAELVLAKDKLSAAELQKVIDEVAKLGKPAEGFVREANNYQRVLEVTDFLVTYTKARALEANSVND